MDQEIEETEASSLGQAIRRAIQAALDEGHHDAAAELNVILLDVPLADGGEPRH